MVVVMLTSKDPSVDGHVASTPRRRAGMDCVIKPSNSNKKLVQARLPFKRLNPEPKETSEPKRIRAPLCPDPGASDGENESECLLLPVPDRPALVNGRGPLDGFMNRRCQVSSAKAVVVDLTEEDSLSTNDTEELHATLDPPQCSPKQDKIKKTIMSPLVKAACSTRTPEVLLGCKVLSNQKTESDEGVERGLEDAKEEEMEKEEEFEDTASMSQLDTTQGSESEQAVADQEESTKADVSSFGDSILSMSSTSSLSAAESSPEPSKAERTTDPTEPKTTPKIPQAERQTRRRSLKSLQEQEEKELKRKEREQQREEAKAAKEKKKEEARKLKEERERERKEKREKEEQDKREKREKEEKEKAEKLKAKEEQRKSKQEAKIEEKKKKDEEKRLKEQKDREKAEKSEIRRFFQKPKTQAAPKTLAAACGKFAPFEIKEHMGLAPLTRVQCDISTLEELDQYLARPDDTLNGLSDWMKNKPRKSGPTKPRQDTNSECVVVVKGSTPDAVLDRKRYGPMKLLQFRENHRPAYWGTWSKKSAFISPRYPLRQDKDLLDYEVESDDEWEEEEPGESLSHSEGDDDDEGGDNEEGGDNDDDDDDDGFFVPHGYLSDGEGALEGEEEGGDQEKQKVRQKLKAREWDELMSKQKVKLLQPVVRGCVWDGEGPPLELFKAFALCLVEPLPKADTTPSPDETAEKHLRDEQLLSQLLPLLHGNINSSKTIITEFQEFCRQQNSPSPCVSSPPNPRDNIPTRIRLMRLIKCSGVYEKRSAYRRCCWYVHAEVLARFNQEALPVPCQWTYLTSGSQALREEAPAATAPGSSPTTPQPSSATTPSTHKRKSTGSMSIKKFMKKCADPEQTEEMEAEAGFQADTEEDDDEDADCIMITPQNESMECISKPSSDREETEKMEEASSDNASRGLPCPAPTPAKA